MINNSYKISFFIFFLLFPYFLQAQENEQETNLESIIESIIEILGDEADASSLVEDLQELAENPININTADENELTRLIILNDVQIQKIIKQRENFGSFLSIYEMNVIDGLNPDILSKIEPFIRFGEQIQKLPNIGESLKYGYHQVLLRTQTVLQKQDGFIPRSNGDIPFEGNPMRFYSRYRFESGLIDAGITSEKDPGETFFKGSNRSGFDYYSGHLNIKFNTFVKNIILGDYYISSGQGLVFGQGFSLGKSNNTQLVAKNNRGLRPYSSTDENFFFRGVAAAFKFGDTKLNLFFSSKYNDGNMELNDSTSFFTSLQTSGYHRTLSENEDEKSVKTTNLGSTFTWNHNNFRIGASVLYQHFALPVKRGSQLYNQFKMEGNSNFNTGIDYIYVKGKYEFFGEAAMSQSKGTAILQGVAARLNDRLSLTALARSYDKKYNATWANSFGESGAANNEKGFYLGTKILPVKRITVSAYSDIYQSDWINYYTAGPARGWDILVQADYRISRKASLYIRYKNEEKDQKTTDGKLYVNQPELTRKTRLHFQYKPSEKLAFKTRFEHIIFKAGSKENGFMVFQDLQYNPSKIPLSFSTRLAWFNTKSYNSRIYAYESDLLYTFSIPAYFGKGVRSYFNLNYKISDKINLWLKLANTFYPEQETISSGYTLIAGNNKTDVKFQVLIKL